MEKRLNEDRLTLINISVKTDKIKIVEKKLGRERAWGRSWRGESFIEIDPRQKSRQYLNTLIHELLHVIYPEESETKVREHSGVLTKYIWEKNYRRIYK